MKVTYVDRDGQTGRTYDCQIVLSGSDAQTELESQGYTVARRWRKKAGRTGKMETWVSLEKFLEEERL